MNKKGLNKKLVIVIAMVFVLVLIFALIYNIFIKKIITNSTDKESGLSSSIGLTGKLKETITNLGNNYTIKYYGFFPNNENKKVKAIVEYTKSQDGFALSSSDLDMYIVCKNGTLKSISKKLKMIFSMPESAFDTSLYSLVGDYSQQFVKTLEEKISDKDYYVEEYKLRENTLKYYFLNDEIKFVRFNEELISIIRIEKNVNNELFDIPSGYTEVGN